MPCPRFWIDTIDGKGFRTHHSQHRTEAKALKVYSSLCFPEGGSVHVYNHNGDPIASKSWPSRAMTTVFFSKD